MAKRKVPKLVTQYLESVSREAFHKHFDVVRDFIGNRNGIYALFDRGQLYYVGLASDLRKRLNSHLKNRHGNSWDMFSVYLTIGDQHLQELESLMVRITQPPGNKQLGRFSGAEDIWKQFYSAIGRKQRRERDRILGIQQEEDDARHLIPKAVRIRATWAGKKVRARLRRDLSVR